MKPLRKLVEEEWAPYEVELFGGEKLVTKITRNKYYDEHDHLVYMGTHMRPYIRAVDGTIR